MSLKKIVHDVTKSIAEKTAPGYVPPVPQKEPLTMAEQHRLIRAKGKLDASVKKLDQVSDFLLATNKDIQVKIENFDLPVIISHLKQVKTELHAHITAIEAALKS